MFLSFIERRSNFLAQQRMMKAGKIVIKVIILG